MIGVIGLGFVGLTTALGFSESGTPTVGFDINKSKCSLINSGRIPFYEPYLDEALSRHLGVNFFIADGIDEVLAKSDIIFVCVGTPKGSEGSADLSQIRSVFDEISKAEIEPDKKIILIKSTVPPSTTDKMREYTYAKNPKLKERILVGMNPEFLREGHSWEDFMNPDRIVVGIDCNKEEKDKINEIYKGFGKNVIFTNPRTAEFLKYLSNTLLSTLISYSNEMSLIAKKIGEIDTKEAFKLLHLDRRFYGEPASIVSYIYPGCGYGGYCLPKDTEAIAKLSIDLGFRPQLLESNIRMNSKIMDFLLSDFIDEHKDRSTRIGILGLAFKPGSDDVRETPAQRCIALLQREGYNNIIAFDPMAMANFAHTYPNLRIEYSNSPQELLSNSQVVFILTAWPEFSQLNYNNKVIYNFRYLSLKHNVDSITNDAL
ncbi:nucleotide sugar dehydrogenase [Thermoplasmatales archaeon AK]|nr:nucleotide sugar dehydrogenase [Thermoplasmatales archaeon AK]